MSLQRYSLCIGISNYDDESLEDLPNATNDANLMHNALRARGFESEVVCDIDDLGLDGALQRLQARVSQAMMDRGAFIVVYFAGHGLEVNGAGFVLLRDFPGEPTLSMVAQRGTPLARLIDTIARYKGPKLVVIDACRVAVGSYLPSDLSTFIDATNHAVAMYPGAASAGDLLVAFSTSTGMPAGDGVGDNSRYCEALVTGLLDHRLQVEDLLSSVGQAVIRDSKMGQRPWYLSALTERVSFSDLASYRSRTLERLTIPHDSSSRIFSCLDGSFVYHSGTKLVLAIHMERTLSQFGREIQAISVGAAIDCVLAANGELTVKNRKGRTALIDTGLNEAHGIEVSRSGESIFIFGRDGCRLIQNKAMSLSIRAIDRDLKGAVFGATFLDDDTLFICGENRQLRRLSSLGGNGARINVDDLDCGNLTHVYDVEIISDRKWLVAVGNAGYVRFFDLQTLDQLDEVCLALAARNLPRDYSALRENLMADAATLFLNDPVEFERHFTEQDQEQAIALAVEATASQDLICCTLLDDSRVLAVGSNEGFVFLIDVRDRKLFRVLDVGGSLGHTLQWMCADRTGLFRCCKTGR